MLESIWFIGIALFGNRLHLACADYGGVLRDLSRSGPWAAEGSSTIRAGADDLMTISYTLTLERRIKLDVHSSTQMNSIAFSSSTKHNNLQAFPLALIVQLSSLVRTQGSGTADGSPEAKPDGSNLSTSHKSFLQNDKEF